MLDTTDHERLNSLLADSAQADFGLVNVPEDVHRWLFADRLAARGVRAEMSFSQYIGHEHLKRFFMWHNAAKFPDFFNQQEIDELVEASRSVDRKLFEHYNISIANEIIEKIARYNAQDFLLSHAYPVPDRQKVKVSLDFGAGHGRLANLGFFAPDPKQKLQTYIAVDAIPSTYFSQLAYFRGIGLSVWEYLEQDVRTVTSDAVRDAIENHDVVHLPTWRFDLIPSASVDMAYAVQVLKELPGSIVPWVIKEIARVVKPQGAFYIRDHLQFHNPNHMPMEQILQSCGFTIEFSPMLKDRSDIHGLPRVWRSFDSSLYTDPA